MPPDTVAMPDFCRPQWVSDGAEALWQPRIRAISNEFQAAERMSVESGIRDAALQSISPDALSGLAGRAATRGLMVMPLKMTGRADYAASSPEVRAGEPFDYRISITTMGGAGRFYEAYQANDDAKMGAMLGYPDCCRKFFARTWGEGSVDPTWAMADHGDGPIEANILLRWLGVRYVPHMPCGFKCEATVALGRKFRTLLTPTVTGWMDELLSQPMLYTALNGIGEVKTPIVKLNFRTDPSPELREIRREGTGYPEAGADGLEFPYRPPPARRSDAQSDLWRDNGFTSIEAMERAHGVILRVVSRETRKVVDLGSGNGMLARKLAGPDGNAIGVENDAAKAVRSKRYLDESVCGDIFDLGLLGEHLPGSDLVVFMPGRVTEANLTDIHRETFLAMLQGRAVLVYAYGDWLASFDGLENLCYGAGMKGKLTERVADAGVEAGIWKWQG